MQKEKQQGLALQHDQHGSPKAEPATHTEEHAQQQNTIEDSDSLPVLGVESYASGGSQDGIDSGMLYLHFPATNIREVTPSNARKNSAELAALDSPPLECSSLQVEFEEAQQT